MDYKWIGNLLLSTGIIDEETLQELLNHPQRTGIHPLLETLKTQLGMEFIDLSQITLSPKLTHLIPQKIVKRHHVVPVRLDKDDLYLAMSNPFDLLAIEEIKHITRKHVIPMLATEEAVDRAILMLYGHEGTARAIEEIRREAGTGDRSPNPTSTESIDGDAASAPTIRLVNAILEQAVAARASDIHIEPREQEITVRIRVDGVLQTLFNLPSDLQRSVLSRLKVMGGMDTAERKIPQDGRANVRIDQRDIDLRISTLPIIYGEKMVIRLLDRHDSFLTRTGIGLDEHDLERYDRLMRHTSGVILLSGPTGSGKSSTMSLMVRELNTDGVNLITLEDPVEYHIDGVNQCQINEKTGMTFANGLRSILRQDPDIIAVGEIRDGETAEIAMRAAITGHLVLSTIHTSGAIATLDRLYDIGVEPYLTAGALRGVIAQRLVRKICPYCRRAYEPASEELDMLGLTIQPGMKFYKGDGCPMCFHTGYRGRTGVFEILLINRSLHQLIRSHAAPEDILTAARKDGFRTISERCLQLVLDGTTTVEEAARTIYSTNEI